MALMGQSFACINKKLPNLAVKVVEQTSIKSSFIEGESIKSFTIMNFIENDDNDFNDSEDEISSDKIDHAKHLSKIHFFSQQLLITKAVFVSFSCNSCRPFLLFLSTLKL